MWLFTSQAIGTRPLLWLGVLLELLAVQLISLGVMSELILHRAPDRGPAEVAVYELAGH